MIITDTVLLAGADLHMSLKHTELVYAAVLLKPQQADIINMFFNLEFFSAEQLASL